MEDISRKVPKAWLYLADLSEELLQDNPEEYVRNCLARYLEGEGKDDSWAWRRMADLYAKAGMRQEQLHALVNLAQAKDCPTYAISNAVNAVNALSRDSQEVDAADRRQLLRELANAFVARKDECTATDLSRLAWLYLTLNDEDSAREVVKLGLTKEPNNIHCINLQQRFA